MGLKPETLKEKDVDLSPGKAGGLYYPDTIRDEFDLQNRGLFIERGDPRTFWFKGHWPIFKQKKSFPIKPIWKLKEDILRKIGRKVKLCINRMDKKIYFYLPTQVNFIISGVHIHRFGEKYNEFQDSRLHGIEEPKKGSACNYFDSQEVCC